ncbi:MAG: hypothetical protein ACI4F1_08790 [Bariatricus sp.]
MLGINDKADIIMKQISESTGICSWGEQLEKKMREGIEKGLEEFEEMEPTRTFPQIQGIVEAAKAGIPVQVGYAETEDIGSETVDGYVRRMCW